jgi:hypothetical protein
MSDTLDAFKRKTSGLTAKDWKKLLKAEVNPRWFWGVAGAVFGFWLLMLLPVFVYSRLVARPSVAVDAALRKETDDRRSALDRAQKLFAAGQYEQTLALCRSVLSRSPNNQIARRYAQMAEAQLTGRAQEAKKSAQSEQSLEAGQKAFGQGDYEEAQKRADEALALDGGRVEAQKLRDDASAKMAEERAARKKPVKPTAAPVRRASVPTAAPPVARAMPSPTAEPAVAGPTTLHLLFDSPVAEGNVMIAVNDQILLRKQFDFRKKEGIFKKVNATGTVDVSLPVKAGAVAVKAWLSGPEIPVSVLAQTSGQIGDGETRVLRLVFESGHLSAKIQ